jgi:hypothetical protein
LRRNCAEEIAMKTQIRMLVAALAAAALSTAALVAEAGGGGGYNHGGGGGGWHGGGGHYGGHGWYGGWGYWGPGYYWPGYWGVGLGVAAVGYSAPYYPYYGYYGGYYGYPAYPAPATGYVVSQPQPGDQTVRSGQPVPSAPPPDPIFYPRHGQSPAQTEVDRQDCNRWATTQSGAMSDAQIFQRATFACMDGRGYSSR